MGGKGGGGSQTTKIEPWSAAKPYLKDSMETAGYLSNIQTPAYPYQQTSPFNALQGNALAAKANYGINATAPMIAGYQSAGQRMVNADDVANNVNVQNMLGVNERRLNRNLIENILPNIGDQAASAGQYGGSAHGVASGIAARGTQEALADANASTMLDAYGKGLGAQGMALGQAGNTLGLGFIPSQTGMEVGTAMQDQNQRFIDEARERFGYPYQEPWDRLGRAMSVFQPAAGLGSSTTAPGQTSSPIAGALGGAMLGNSAATAFGGAAGALPWLTPGLGMGIGAGLGLLGSWL